MITATSIQPVAISNVLVVSKAGLTNLYSVYPYPRKLRRCNVAATDSPSTVHRVAMPGRYGLDKQLPGHREYGHGGFLNCPPNLRQVSLRSAA